MLAGVMIDEAPLHHQVGGQGDDHQHGDDHQRHDGGPVAEQAAHRILEEGAWLVVNLFAQLDRLGSIRHGHNDTAP